MHHCVYLSVCLQTRKRIIDDHNDETIKVEAIGEKEKKIISMVLARSNNKTRALLLLPTANTISQSVHL